MVIRHRLRETRGLQIRTTPSCRFIFCPVVPRLWRLRYLPRQVRLPGSRAFHGEMSSGLAVPKLAISFSARCLSGDYFLACEWRSFLLNRACPVLSLLPARHALSSFVHSLGRGMFGERLMFAIYLKLPGALHVALLPFSFFFLVIYRSFDYSRWLLASLRIGEEWTRVDLCLSRVPRKSPLSPPVKLSDYQRWCR